jgi:hypothetical protein
MPNSHFDSLEKIYMFQCKSIRFKLELTPFDHPTPDTLEKLHDSLCFALLT